MWTTFSIEENRACFFVHDVAERYSETVRALGFRDAETGFARYFPADCPHLDRVYANFARHIEELILQTAGIRSAPWASALDTFLHRVEGHGVDWFLAGSAALAVRGLDVHPRDIDIAVDDVGAQRLGELLLDCLVEPVSPVEDWFCNWWGRAF